MTTIDQDSYGSTNHVLEVTATTGTVNVNASQYISGGSNIAGVRIASGANCTVNIAGKIYASATSGTSGHGVEVLALSPTVSVTSDVIQGDVGGAGIYLSSSNATLNATVTNLGNSPGVGILLNSQSGNTATINLTGHVVGGTASGCHAVSVIGSASSGTNVNIIGYVQGGEIGAYGVSYIGGHVSLDGEINYAGNSDYGYERGTPPLMPTSSSAFPFTLVDSSNKKFTTKASDGSAEINLTGSGGGSGPTRPSTGMQWPLSR